MVGIFILGFAFAFCAGIIKKHCSVIEWNGSTYNIENVNALDAIFARPYNEKLDDIGDLVLSLTCMGSMLIVFISFLISLFLATHISILLSSPLYAPFAGIIETPLGEFEIIAFETSSAFFVNIIRHFPLPVP